MRAALLLLAALALAASTAEAAKGHVGTCKDAVAKLGLDVTGSTVFCPTDGAFVEFSRELGFRGKDPIGQLLKGVPSDTLKLVLSNHVVPGKVLPSSALKASEPLPTLAKSTLKVETSKNGKKVTVAYNGVDVDGDPKNDDDLARVGGKDLTFDGAFAAGKSKYVVHPVQRVLVPEAALAPLKVLRAKNLGVGAKAVPKAPATASELATFKAAAAKLGLDLDGATVFAPTDGAFVEFARDVGFTGADVVGSLLSTVPAATLKTVLSAHVVPGQLVTAAALEKGPTLTTLAKTPIKAFVSKGGDLALEFNGVDVDGDSHNDDPDQQNEFGVVDVQGTDLTFDGPFAAGKSKLIVQALGRVIVPPSVLEELRVVRAKNLGLATAPVKAASVGAAAPAGNAAVPVSLLSTCKQVAVTAGVIIGGSTLFCPTNEAFAKFAVDLGFSGPDPTAAMLSTVPLPTLKKVLENHVIPKVLTASDFKKKGSKLKTRLGTTLEVKKLAGKQLEVLDNGVDVDDNFHNDRDPHKVEGLDLTFLGAYAKGKSKYVVQAVDRVFVPPSALAELKALRTKNLAAGAGRRMLLAA